MVKGWPRIIKFVQIMDKARMVHSVIKYSAFIDATVEYMVELHIHMIDLRGQS